MTILEYKKIFSTLLGAKTKSVPWLIFLFCVIALFDLVGIGLIGPYISYSMEPDKYSGNYFTSFLENSFFQKYDSKNLIAFFLVIIFSIKLITTIWINKKILWFCADIKIWLRSVLMQNYQEMDYSSYISGDSSNYINNTSILTMYFTNNVLYLCMKAIAEFTVGLALFSLLVWINGLLVLFLLLLIGSVAGGYQLIFQKKLQAYGQTVNESQANLVKGVKEGLEGLKEIRILNKESFFKDSVDKHSIEMAHSQAKAMLISSANRYVLEFIIILFFVGSLSVFTMVFADQTTNIYATLAVFGFAAIRLMPVMTSISTAIFQFNNHKNTMLRLYEDLSDRNTNNLKLSEGLNNQLDSDIFKTLTIEHVYFSYQGEKNVIRDVSFKVKSDQIIGFMGSSGSGKTTLIDIILGLLRPSKGKLLINNKELEDISTWQSRIAYIPQDILLVNDTLRKNITLEHKLPDTKSQESLKEAIKQAHLEEVVKQLPDGLDTYLGERGVRLSGGQKQRVALARALYHQREILIFDEATSALDNETEKEIAKEINSLKGKKTIFLIAHRLETLRDCNYIFKIEDGMIASSGTPEEMLG